ncbi:TetR family transcriptional regulator [Paraburkholderia sp. J67]|uniref:TetR family transcriptional regulator n=1 Tax=Paraburkholderia sp. J67 TaxID=2805435 RepID=UPI002ABDC058|nr:TetR family transcriptional regulator [Paraburkholderia sp. J67]
MTEAQLAHKDQADRLTGAALALACERGLDALSARTLAAYTGGSPSAINYHFGGREQLLSQVYRQAMIRADVERKRALAACLEALPSWADLPHAFAALLQARLSRERGLATLLQELEQEVTTEREPSLHAYALEEIEREWAYWRDFTQRFGAAEDAADAWAELALGLLGLLMCESDASVRSAWITGPAERLHRRIARQPVEPAVLRDTPAAAVEREAPANETARAILDAALTTIARKGAQHVVQREIAAMAGVSLASVTYFFRTKQDLINATFAELCRRLRGRVEAFEQLSPEQSTPLALTFGEKENLAGLASLNALLRAAARDPSLAAIAREIRQLRGIGSFVMLSKRGLSTDWLDAYVWAMLLSGRYRKVLLLDEAHQVEALAHTANRTLTIVFGADAVPGGR